MTVVNVFLDKIRQRALTVQVKSREFDKTSLVRQKQGFNRLVFLLSDVNCKTT